MLTFIISKCIYTNSCTNDEILMLNCLICEGIYANFSNSVGHLC